MSGPRIVASPRVTRGVSKNLDSIVAVTPWTLAAGVTSLRFTRQVNGVSGGVQTSLAYQLAPVLTSVPGGWQDVASSTVDPSTNEWDTRQATITNTSNMWVRGGLKAIGDGSSTPADLSAQLWMQTDGASEIIAARTFQGRSNFNLYYNNPILATVPCKGISKWMLAIDFGSDGTNFKFWPLHALIANDPEEGWSSPVLQTQESWTTTRKLWNSGEISVTDSSTSAWLRCALRTRVNASCAATLRVVAAAIY